MKFILDSDVINGKDLLCGFKGLCLFGAVKTCFVYHQSGSSINKWLAAWSSAVLDT